MTEPLVSIIAAVARNGVIGRGNALPWRIPEDMKRFRKITMGKPMIMGRRTHESIGRVLPGRRNIVLTRRGDGVLEGCERAGSFEEAMAMAFDAPGGEPVPEVMVIGGEQCYRLALPSVQRIYLTSIDAEIEGDTRFPEWDSLAEWKFTVGWAMNEKQPGVISLGGMENGVDYFFSMLERGSPAASQSTERVAPV